MFAPINRMLARIMPYQEGNRFYYPVLWFDQCSLILPTNVATNATNPAQNYSYDFNWSTGIIGTTTSQISLTIQVNYITLFAAWNTCMANAQVFVPIGPRLPPSRMNFAQCTWTAYYSSGLVNSYNLVAKRRFPTNIQALITTTVIPELFITATMNASTTVDVALIQSYYNEPHIEWFGSTLPQESIIFARIMDTMHDKYNKGSADAETDDTKSDNPLELNATIDEGNSTSVYGTMMSTLYAGIPWATSIVANRVMDQMQRAANPIRDLNNNNPPNNGVVDDILRYRALLGQ
jgi:hypothetical protein